MVNVPARLELYVRQVDPVELSNFKAAKGSIAPLTVCHCWDLASILTTGNNAPGKSVFQFMGLLISIFYIEAVGS